MAIADSESPGRITVHGDQAQDPKLAHAGGPARGLVSSGGQRDRAEGICKTCNGSAATGPWGGGRRTRILDEDASAALAMTACAAIPGSAGRLLRKASGNAQDETSATPAA
jgi:hypothetical protein